jgi:hypothetical protein
MSDKGKKDDNKGDDKSPPNPFAKANAEQRAAYRAALDAADSADGTAPSYPKEFDALVTRPGTLSDAEFALAKARAFSWASREAARERTEAADKARAGSAIDGLA